MVVTGTVLVAFHPFVEAAGVNFLVLGLHDEGLVSIVAHDDQEVLN